MAGKFQGAATTPGAGTNGAPDRAQLAKQSIELAFDHHQAGRVKEAESLYQQALAILPGQIDALYYLGVLYLQNGVHDAAEEFITKALRKQPKFAEGHFNLGVALQAQNKLKEAAKSFNQAIKGDKKFAPAQLNLGNVYMDLEQYDRASSVFRKLIKLSPKSDQAYLNLGRASSLKGDKDEAMIAYRHALEINPSYADAYLNIGAILLESNECEEAKTYFQQALESDPKNAEAYNNMGVAWKRDGYVDHAFSCFARATEIKPDYGDARNNIGSVLYAFGDTDEAEAEVRKGIELSPDSPSAYCILGKILRSKNKPLESIDALNKAIRLAPDISEPYREMGLTLSENNQIDAAIRAYRLGISCDPKDGIAHNNLGMCHVMRGELDEALECFDAAIEAIPTFSLAHSNKLFSLNYMPSLPHEELVREHFAFGELWDQPYDENAFTNPPDPNRKLKIGYVSPDFRKHVVLTFIEEMLKNHDRDQVELYAYAEVFKSDDRTEQVKGYMDHWRYTIERNSYEIAQQIRDDGIDILVDLAGHTGNNRLPVFALKPAPVQVSWIGYPNTTGLRNMDYILMTSHFLPEGGESDFTEEVYNLPRVPVTYKAPERPDIGRSPFETNGHVTFGCFNNVIKAGPAAIEAWSEVLKAVPDSKLLLKAHAFRNEVTVTASKAMFESHGVDPERITCEGPSEHHIYLTRYSDIDLALDPFPYNGGTTSLDTLYVGVPLLSLEGSTWVSRNGSGILRIVGEESLIASSVEDYVAKAVDFALNPEKLAELRGNLHERFMATGITDHVAQTRDLENAFRDMWQRWCATRNAA